MKKKRTIIIAVVLLIIASIIAIVTILYKTNKNKEEQANKEIFEKNVIRPDRIVYKNGQKYYEIKPEENLYKEIIEEMSKKINTSKKETIITQEEVDDIHNLESFIEFDYNTASKNYTLAFQDDSKFIKLMDSGAELIKSNIPDTKTIQNLIDSKIQDKKYYTMEQNKEYISENPINSIEYKYLQEFDNKRKWSISKSN